MQVVAYKSPLIKAKQDLFAVFCSVVAKIEERSIIVIASKVFATSENRFVPKITGDKAEKWELAKQEADYYLEPTDSTYNVMLTIKNNWMFANAGIDESNANDQYLMWPADPQASVNVFWHKMRDYYKLHQVGLIMTDSASRPLNWGVVGQAIAHCGFNPLYSYIGRQDLFSRQLKMEQLNIMQSVAAAACVEMGEGNESTPFAVVTNLALPVEFYDHVPTDQELKQLKIDLKDDIYAPLHQSAGWIKGGARQ